MDIIHNHPPTMEIVKTCEFCNLYGNIFCNGYIDHNDSENKGLIDLYDKMYVFKIHDQQNKYIKNKNN